MSTDWQNSPAIGVALGGGAAHGIAHIGVLQVLEEAEIPVAYLAGTSAGALVGLCYAAGLSLDRLVELARQVRWRDLGRLTVPRRGLASNEPLADLVRRELGGVRFEDLRIPLRIVATDIWTSHRVILDRGDALLALRATCAVPGLFAPVEWEGRSLVDGGLVEILPAPTVREMGAEVVIGVDVNRRFSFREPPHNLFQILMSSLHILLRRLTREADREVDLLVTPEVGEITWDALDRAGELLAAGRAAMRAQLPALRAILEQTGPPRSVRSPRLPTLGAS